MSFIKQLHDEHRMTVLHMTHRLEEALEYSDRIVVLNDGRLYADFHPSTIRDHWQRLEHIRFVKTPLLRCIDALGKQFANKLLSNIYKEEQLISFITNFPKENL